jgi:cobalt-zinc-cadmium efflux system protein
MVLVDAKVSAMIHSLGHGHMDGAAKDLIHEHAHAPVHYGARFGIGIGLNLIIVILQVVFGVIANSVALIADAGHNLSDGLSLGVAFAATILARRTPSQRFTYGFRATSILAALFNAVFLLVITGGLSYAAIERLLRPEPVSAKTMMAVAAAGIVVNAIAAALFASGRNSDLNIRGAFLHMAADAAVSAGVVIAGLAIALTGQQWLDPAMSLIINAVIIVGTWRLLREALAMSLAGVPAGIAAAEVRRFLSNMPGVAGLHDLHIWPMSTHEIALTAHLVIPGGHPSDAFLMQAAAELRKRYSIGHVTLQVETEQDSTCALAPDDVV